MCVWVVGGGGGGRPGGGGGWGGPHPHATGASAAVPPLPAPFPPATASLATVVVLPGDARHLIQVVHIPGRVGGGGGGAVDTRVCASGHRMGALGAPPRPSICPPRNPLVRAAHGGHQQARKLDGAWLGPPLRQWGSAHRQALSAAADAPCPPPCPPAPASPPFLHAPPPLRPPSKPTWLLMRMVAVGQRLAK